MLAGFQKKKLRRLFDVLDSDHNGQLERDDYGKMIVNLTWINGWQAGSDEYSALEALYITI